MARSPEESGREGGGGRSDGHGRGMIHSRGQEGRGAWGGTASRRRSARPLPSNHPPSRQFAWRGAWRERPEGASGTNGTSRRASPGVGRDPSPPGRIGTTPQGHHNRVRRRRASTGPPGPTERVGKRQVGRSRRQAGRGGRGEAVLPTPAAASISPNQGATGTSRAIPWSPDATPGPISGSSARRVAGASSAATAASFSTSNAWSPSARVNGPSPPQSTPHDASRDDPGSSASATRPEASGSAARGGVTSSRDGDSSLSAGSSHRPGSSTVATPSTITGGTAAASPSLGGNGPSEPRASPHDSSRGDSAPGTSTTCSASTTWSEASGSAARGGVASSLDGDGSPSVQTEAGSSTRPGPSTFATSSAITGVTATASSSLGINGPS